MRIGQHRITRSLGLLFCMLALAVAAVALDDTASGDKGKSAFKANCITCHGADGAGTRIGKSMNAPDLRSDDVQKQTDAEFTQAISEGKGNMPSFKHNLSPEQIQDLVSFVRELGKTKPPAAK